MSTPTHDPLQLTLREHQALSLLAIGCSNKEIAARMGISRKAVQNLLYIVYQKMGVSRNNKRVYVRVVAALRYQEWRLNRDGCDNSKTQGEM